MQANRCLAGTFRPVNLDDPPPRNTAAQSQIQAEGTAARNRIAGTIFGGTGRYAGVSGTYEFSWQFVIEAEDGSIQGRAVGLKGRVRSGSGAKGAAG